MDSMDIESPKRAVSDLPVELLIRIFLDAIPEGYYCTQPSRRAVPLQLCHVSSLWRGIAQSLPQLWKTLRIRLSILTYIARKEDGLVETGRFLSPPDQDFLAWWLSHLPPSYSLKLFLDPPLDLRAFYHTNKHTGEVYKDSSLRKYPYADLYGSPLFRRVRELEMLLPENDLVLLNSSELSNLVNLETVTLSITKSPGFYYHVDSLKDFPPAPQLTQLSITYARLLYIFPTQQLTQLCIAEDIQSSFLRHIFTTLCPNLINARFTLQSPIGPNVFFLPQYSAPSAIPSLRCFILSHCTFTDFRHLDHGLIFPSIHALQLRKANTRVGRVSYEALTKYLDAFPGLNELYLDDSFFPIPTVFEHGLDLSRLRKLKDLLPQLCKVTIELNQGVRTERARDFLKSIILSSWIRPSNDTRGGHGWLEILLPPRGNRISRVEYDRTYEDRLVGEVAAYWKRNRAQLNCDVAFRLSNRSGLDGVI